MKRSYRNRKTVITGVVAGASMLVIGFGVGFMYPQNNSSDNFSTAPKQLQTTNSSLEKAKAELESTNSKLATAKEDATKAQETKENAQKASDSITSQIPAKQQELQDIQTKIDTAKASVNQQTDSTPAGGSSSMATTIYKSWDEMIAGLSAQYPQLNGLDLKMYASTSSPSYLNMTKNYNSNKDVATQAFIKDNPVNLSGAQLNQLACFMYDEFQAIHDGQYQGNLQ